MADGRWGLLQHQTKLYLFDVTALSRDLMYQQVAGLVTELLIEKAPLLSECLSLDVDTSTGSLTSLPLLIDGHRPDPGRLPGLLLALARDVEWDEERACFASLAHAVADAYAVRGLMLPDGWAPAPEPVASAAEGAAGVGAAGGSRGAAAPGASGAAAPAAHGGVVDGGEIDGDDDDVGGAWGAGEGGAGEGGEELSPDAVAAGASPGAAAALVAAARGAVAAAARSAREAGGRGEGGGAPGSARAGAAAGDGDVDMADADGAGADAAGTAGSGGGARDGAGAMDIEELEGGGNGDGAANGARDQGGDTAPPAPPAAGRRGREVADQEWMIKHVVLTSMRGLLRPHRGRATDGSCVQVASLERLYRIFERC
ncbi:hypothetical protein FOA52_008001 [Chlamydomonas sp. UWO 241]|nr:hypothetical protein FOA52_008001 [Chlamydomonas sp. UWO 241]